MQGGRNAALAWARFGVAVAAFVVVAVLSVGGVDAVRMPAPHHQHHHDAKVPVLLDDSSSSKSRRWLTAVENFCYNETIQHIQECVGTEVMIDGEFLWYGYNESMMLQGQGLNTYNATSEVMGLLVSDSWDGFATKAMQLDVAAGHRLGDLIDVHTYLTSIIIVGAGQYIEMDRTVQRTIVTGYRSQDIVERHFPVRHAFFEIDHATNSVKDLNLTVEDLLGSMAMKHNLVDVLGGKLSAYDQEKRVFWQVMARNNTDDDIHGKVEYIAYGVNIEERTLEGFWVFPLGDCEGIMGQLVWDEANRKIVYPFNPTKDTFAVGTFDPYTGEW